MRHTNFCTWLLFYLLFISCNKEYSESPVHFEGIQKRSEFYTLRAIDHHLLLLKNSGKVDDDIYILENTNVANFTRNLEILHLVESTGGLEIQLADGNFIKWSLTISNPADYYGKGFSKVSGPYHYKLFYGVNGLLEDPDLEYIKCKCNSSQTNENCDAGGKGSADCSISGSATGGGTGIQEKCSVKCATGYYACCKKV